MEMKDMAIGLMLSNANAEFLPGPSFKFTIELSEYFWSFKGFPNLQWLGNLDPYGYHFFLTSVAREAMLREIDTILEKARKRDWPEPPPRLEDSEWGQHLDPFGWNGLEKTLLRLREILERARKPGEYIWIVAD